MPERMCQRPGCGRPIPSRKRRDARWCSRSCESRARRAAKRKADFETANPDAAKLLGTEHQSLAELHQRARPPAHWRDIEAGDVDPDLAEFSDYPDIGQEDDEDVGSAPGPWRQHDESWRVQMELADAIDAIRAEYDRRARPFLQQQRRNPGVLRPELAALMRERDARIAELTRVHQRAQAMERAAREQPYRRASAHERELERAAAKAFALDLGRGRFLRAEPADAGRNVRDAWVW